MNFLKSICAAALLLFAVTVQASTNIAANATWTAVNNAALLSVPGDVILIPTNAAPAYWSNTLYLTNVCLVGGGTNFTVVYDACTNLQYANGPLIPLIKVFANNSAFNKATYVSGIRFISTGVPINGQNQARIEVSSLNSGDVSHLATNAPSVFENCSFENFLDNNIRFGNGNAGVVRNCSFWTATHAVRVDGTLGAGDLGDAAYTLPAPYGTTNQLVFENNFFTNTSSSGDAGAVIDAYTGASITVRYNTLLNTFISNHGLDSSASERSGRMMEIYGNTIAASDPHWNNLYAVVFRGGSGVVFSNTIIGYASGTVAIAQTYRNTMFNIAPYYGASGVNPWDSNGPVVVSYTMTSAAPLVDSITNCTGTNWTVDAFKGYTVRATNIFYVVPRLNPSRTVTNGYQTNYLYAIITGNTATTATFGQAKNDGDYYLRTGQGNNDTVSTIWSNNAAIEIRKVYPQMDQAGLGSGDLIVALPGDVVERSNTVTHSFAFPREASEPIYMWSNVVNGVLKNTVGLAANVTLGTDIFTNQLKPGYTPLVYPHPLPSFSVAGVGGATNPPTTTNGYKISTMAQATAIADGDLFPVVQTNSTGGNTNRNVTAATAKGYFLTTPIIKVWPDMVWGLGDSKSCEFRTNGNTWSVHGGYSNQFVINLYPPYNTNNGIFTYTNGAFGIVVTNGGSWMVYFTNRVQALSGKSTILNNSLAQSGLAMGSYVGTPYLTKGTQWIPPYTSPNGGDPLLYMATNQTYTGRQWVLVHGGQNDLVVTNSDGLWQTMTNLYAAIRAQNKIVIASTITITPSMFQVPAVPDWTQLTSAGTNIMQFNARLRTNQFVADGFVDVQASVSNRVFNVTNWWDGTHPIDSEADFEASVWVSSLDTNTVFWRNVASYQAPSFQLARWANLNPDTYRVPSALTNNNTAGQTNIGPMQVGDSLSIIVQTTSARLNVGNNNDAYARFGGGLNDSTSALFGMSGGGGWWFTDIAAGDTMAYSKAGSAVVIGDGGAGSRGSGIKVNSVGVFMTNLPVTVATIKGGFISTNGGVGITTNYVIPSGATLYITNGIIVKLQ